MSSHSVFKKRETQSPGLGAHGHLRRGLPWGAPQMEGGLCTAKTTLWPAELRWAWAVGCCVNESFRKRSCWLQRFHSGLCFGAAHQSQSLWAAIRSLKIISMCILYMEFMTIYLRCFSEKGLDFPTLDSRDDLSHCRRWQRIRFAPRIPGSAGEYMWYWRGSGLPKIVRFPFRHQNPTDKKGVITIYCLWSHGHTQYMPLTFLWNLKYRSSSHSYMCPCSKLWVWLVNIHQFGFPGWDAWPFIHFIPSFDHGWLEHVPSIDDFPIHTVMTCLMTSGCCIRPYSTSKINKTNRPNWYFLGAW